MACFENLQTSSNKGKFFKNVVFHIRRGSQAIINLNISGSGSLFMRYGDMIHNWHKQQAEAAEITIVYRLVAGYVGRLDSAWDLL